MKYEDMDKATKQEIANKMIEILESSTGFPNCRVGLKEADGKEREFFVTEDIFNKAMAVVTEYEMNYTDHGPSEYDFETGETKEL